MRNVKDGSVRLKKTSDKPDGIFTRNFHGEHKLKESKTKRLYIVKEINGNLITVSPLQKDDNKKNEARPQIEALNPQKLRIQKGSVVYVALASQIEYLAGIFILLAPVITAFLGYFTSVFAEKAFESVFPQSIKFLFSAFLFVLVSLIEFILTRNIKTVLKPVLIRVKKF